MSKLSKLVNSLNQVNELTESDVENISELMATGMIGGTVNEGCGNQSCYNAMCYDGVNALCTNSGCHPVSMVNTFCDNYSCVNDGNCHY